MDPTSGLNELVAVAEHGSVSAAARALGVPRATLSRRIAALEQELGATLFHRSTRRLVPTRAGATLLEVAARLVADARAAKARVQRDDEQPRGLLRVTAAVGPESARFAEMFASFLERHPQVEIEILATPRTVDLREEGYDVALRAGEVRDQSLVGRVLDHIRLLAVAAPSLLARHPIDSLEALAQAPCVLGLGPRASWPLRDGGAVGISGRITCNDLHQHAALARSGRAVALLPMPWVLEELAGGRLVPVLPELVGTEAKLWVVWPAVEHLDPKVRAFVDHVVAWTREHPLLPRG